MSNDDLTTTYCTPEDVAETMDLPDPNDPIGSFMFSDMSHPSYDRVCKMIRSNEDMIDRRLRRSWRVNYVRNYNCDINSYQWDEDGYRGAYYLQGGDYVQLRKDMLPWDPSKGDKLEVRNAQNLWCDVTNYSVEDLKGESQPPAGDGWKVWFDYNMGKMYIRTRWFQNKYNGLRISYRYGKDVTDPESPNYDELPPSINRLCCLLTASQVLNMNAFYIKLGSGGDISGIRDSILYNWQEEMNSLWSMWQRSGSVHSLYR